MDRLTINTLNPKMQALPATISSLRKDLVALGVKPEMVLVVHCSFRQLGFVCGGPQAVILALQAVLTDAGTLVMPTHSMDLTEPSDWQRPAVPEHWWPVIRAESPAFDPVSTPTRNMGTLAETFRKCPGVLRSMHPHVSFAAWGKYASHITSSHSNVADLFGPETPIGRVRELGGYVLLLGVGHERNTSLHLAEVIANLPEQKRRINGAPVMVSGERKWAAFEELDWDNDDFAELANHFERGAHLELVGKVSQASAILVPQRPLVDFAVEWMKKNRRARFASTGNK